MWIGICVNVCVQIVKLLVERLSYITRCTFDAYAQSSQHSMSLIYDRDYLVKTSFQSNRDKKCWYVVQSSFYRKLCKFCVVFLLIQLYQKDFIWWRKMENLCWFYHIKFILMNEEVEYYNMILKKYNNRSNLTLFVFFV